MILPDMVNVEVIAFNGLLAGLAEFTLNRYPEPGVTAPRLPEMEPGLAAGPAEIVAIMLPAKLPLASLSSSEALVATVHPAKLKVTVTLVLGHTGVPVVSTALLGCAKIGPLRKSKGNVTRNNFRKDFFNFSPR